VPTFARRRVVQKPPAAPLANLAASATAVEDLCRKLQRLAVTGSAPPAALAQAAALLRRVEKAAGETARAIEGR